MTRLGSHRALASDWTKAAVRTMAAGAAALWLAAPIWVGGAVAGAAPAAAAVRYAIVPESSTVTYRVAETFFAGNQLTTAIGTTHAIQGDVLVDRAHPANSRIGTITIDISTLQSDRGGRDRAIRQRWLESAKYPRATFTPTAISGLPASYVEGQDIPVQIAGDLHVRDVTRPVTFSGTVRLAADTLTGSFHTTVLMTDFRFEPPSITMLKTENQVNLELQFTAQRLPS